MVSAARRMVSAISFGRLLAIGPLHQGDHAVQEGLAGLGRDLDHDAVGEDGRPAGDRRAISAGLADDRGGLPGDGRFVHRGHAFDDLAVRGDVVPGLADDPVTLDQRRRRHQFLGAIGEQTAGHRSPSASCAGRKPVPCPALRPWPRRSWRRAR